MKAEYKLSLWGNQHKSTNHVTAATPTFCCEDMTDAWHPWSLGLALDEDRRVVGVQGYDGYEGSDLEFLPVEGFRVCPWCAEPIEVVQVGETDNRVKACKAELAHRNHWDKGKPIMCSKNAAQDSDYCHIHTQRHQAEVMAAALREA